MSPACDNCDSHVSSRYYRVRKGNDGDLHACPSCADQANRQRKAAGLETDYRQRATPSGKSNIARQELATDGGDR